LRCTDVITTLLYFSIAYKNASLHGWKQIDHCRQFNTRYVHVLHLAVLHAKDNNGVLDALTTGSAKVAAASAWLWAREEMAHSVDVLLVDEA
jgi:hypothetical protein